MTAKVKKTKTVTCVVRCLMCKDELTETCIRMGECTSCGAPFSSIRHKGDQQILWKSPPIPGRVLKREDFMEKFLAQLDVQRSTDSPSSSDLWSIFIRYNRSTAAERDAIDAAFVWFSGYSLASLAAMAVSKDPSKYDDLLMKWRARRCISKSNGD